MCRAESGMKTVRQQGQAPKHMGAVDGAFKRFLASLTLALATLGAGLAAPAAMAHWGTPALASIDVFDRVDGTTLPVYAYGGQQYVVGTPGHEYTLRIRNLTGERILAVTSVDGVNVVSGETAAPDQSGYVIDAYGSVDIAGWRKSLARTAAFYFTDLGDSYAARTGRPGNVGVIGVAVFRERQRPIAYSQPRDRIAGADAAAEAAPHAQSNEPAAQLQEKSAGRLQRSAPMAETPSPLGTGHGRDEASYATRVAFERASSAPAEVLAVRYDRREALVSMGVLPRESYYARRGPQPFPGALRFVPDPR